MVEYENTFLFPVLFASETPSAVLAEVLSDARLRQFHCAETEKYPYVTYFFNGGRDDEFAGEDRQMVPSPAVLTYDLQPEMSADAVVAAIERQVYHFIMVTRQRRYGRAYRGASSHHSGGGDPRPPVSPGGTSGFAPSNSRRSDRRPWKLR